MNDSITKLEHFDIVVLGAGPAGQKAAVQGAKAGRRVLVIEREATVGGECVHRGTIPSKTLRESARNFQALKRRAGHLVGDLRPQTLVQSLMERVDGVERNHERYLAQQLARNHVDFRQGRARFLSPRAIEINAVDGSRTHVAGDVIVIATGSRPRAPSDVPVDHEHVLDSDSILSMICLPESLVVLGSGVIACEFATIFQALGVAVTIVDKAQRPLGFLDPELTDRFVQRFEKDGGTFLGGVRHQRVALDGFEVQIKLDDGRELRAERVLAALGRTASIAGLAIENAGLAVNERGFLQVDHVCRTQVPHIFAVGDVIGPPALAASAMEQGRRAVRAALGLDVGTAAGAMPSGIYTLPEMASVGLSELEARTRHGEVVVGRANFDEIARGQISGETDGFLKLVCDARGERVLGASIIGEGATELVHLAQLAIVAEMSVDAFVDNIFNFPTLAEAYRVAALDVCGKRMRLRAVV